MTNVTRREFLTASGISAAFLGLGYLGGRNAWSRPLHRGFGPLAKDPKGILDLPAGFSYVEFGKAGDEMDDGLRVPMAHDGMATFPGPGGKTIVVRNHELINQGGPWDTDDVRLEPEHLAKMYEPGKLGDDSHRGHCAGGTTTFVFDTQRQRLEKQWLSLAGTIRNCAGGPTPWGSWLSCEECVFVKDKFGMERDHGYVFEVPAESTPRLVEAVPLEALGRINHEACAVDPRTGIVYQTEDRGDSLFYRLIPNKRGKLLAGGRLQALVILDHPSANTSNHQVLGGFGLGETYTVGWVDVDARSPEDDLRHQGYARGAARFSRGEGLWWGQGGAVFTCTSGGPTHAGQVWRFEPAADDDPATERSPAGTLRLIAQPSRSAYENVDNLTIAPWGDLIACEDGPAPNRLVGITPTGDVYHLAENAVSGSELTGVCFSPDGTTLFVNIQVPGSTFAIRGPWWHRARPGAGA